MLGVAAGVFGRHLMGAEGPFDAHAVDLGGPGPAFRAP